MLTFNIIIGILSVIALCLASWWAVRSWQKDQLSSLISRELLTLHAKTVDQRAPNDTEGVKKGKNFTAKTMSGLGDPELLSSPEMLSTLVTVLIHKYGDTRLGLDDFMIGDDKFVSVYVDTATQEILLSLDNELANSLEDALVSFANGTSDDKTYH